MLAQSLRKVVRVVKRFGEKPVRPDENAQMANVRKYWTPERIAEAVGRFESGDLVSANFHMGILAAAPEIARYRNVLDFGSGTGHQDLFLARQFPGVQFHCYDLAYEASPELHRALTELKLAPNLRFIDNYADGLSRADLVYSNAVFSHMDPDALKAFLTKVKRQGAALLMMSASLIKQSARGTLCRPRGSGSSLFDHNYVRLLGEIGFEIGWSYHIASGSDPDKRMIALFAK